jgi:DNA-binding CsgD family transcriptional regulator
MAVTEAALRELTAADVDDPPCAAVVRLETVWVGLTTLDPRLVGKFDRRLDELLAIVREHDESTQALALLLGCNLGARGGQPERAAALVEQGLDGGRLLEQAGPNGSLFPYALSALILMDQLDRADAAVEQLLAAARAAGDVLALSVGLAFRVALRDRRGDLAGAETDLCTVLELVHERALVRVLPQLLHFGAETVIERLELADVSAIVSNLDLEPDFARTASGAMLREVRGRMALADGRSATAVVDLQAAATTYEALHIFNPNWSCWRSALALAIPGDDRGEALRLANAELEDAQRLELATPIGIALRTIGVLEGGEAGVRRLQRAVEVLEDSYARVEHARALVELGAALRRANQRKAARAPLRSGLDLAQHSGASRLVERARLELRATGAKPRRAVLTGLQALTPSERRIAELAAQGMSNPEIAQALFVTLNTVEGHLRHVYQKLSISSRRELGGVLEPAA